MPKTEMSKLLAEIDAEAITDRQAISLYVSKHVFKEFQRKCGDRSASRIVEKLMQWFCEETDEDAA